MFVVMHTGNTVATFTYLKIGTPYEVEGGTACGCGGANPTNDGEDTPNPRFTDCSPTPELGTDGAGACTPNPTAPLPDAVPKLETKGAGDCTCGLKSDTPNP